MEQARRSGSAICRRRSRGASPWRTTTARRCSTCRLPEKREVTAAGGGPRQTAPGNADETQQASGRTPLQRRMVILQNGGIAPSSSARICNVVPHPVASPAGRSRSLFCVHGSAVSGKSLEARLAAPLRDHVVVLAPDRLGQAPGESAEPAERPTGFDAEAEHLAVMLWLRGARATVHLFGTVTAARSPCRWRCAGPSGWRGLTLYEPTRFALLLGGGRALGEAGGGDPGRRSWHPARAGRPRKRPAARVFARLLVR